MSIASCEIRVHPTGKAIARFGTKSQGQGHETTYAQILAEELGIPAAHIQIEEGDTDTAPYGLGTYASRSTPVGGAAAAKAARKVRAKARKIAAHLLEVSEEDLEWEPGKFFIKGVPDPDLATVEHLEAEDVEVLGITGAYHLGEAGDSDAHQLAPRALLGLFPSQIVVADLVHS